MPGTVPKYAGNGSERFLRTVRSGPWNGSKRFQIKSEEVRERFETVPIMVPDEAGNGLKRFPRRRGAESDFGGQLHAIPSSKAYLT